MVKAALEQVGEETSAILQRAHETADEIATRSRSQAGGRVQQAEEEAQQIVARGRAARAAPRDGHLNLWDERARLIEDMRQLAEEVLSTADSAQERIAPPSEPVAEADTVVTDPCPPTPRPSPMRAAQAEEPAA